MTIGKKVTMSLAAAALALTSFAAAPAQASDRAAIELLAGAAAVAIIAGAANAHPHRTVVVTRDVYPTRWEHGPRRWAWEHRHERRWSWDQGRDRHWPGERGRAYGFGH